MFQSLASLIGSDVTNGIVSFSDINMSVICLKMASG